MLDHEGNCSGVKLATDFNAENKAIKEPTCLQNTINIERKVINAILCFANTLEVESLTRCSFSVLSYCILAAGPSLEVLFQGVVFDELDNKMGVQLFADKLAKFADEIILQGQKRLVFEPHFFLIFLPGGMSHPLSLL